MRRIIACVLLIASLRLAMPEGLLAADLKPAKLTCEYMLNPLGIGMSNPRLSWTLTAPGRNERQTAFELIVSDNTRDIAAGKGNVWQTGKVASGQSLHVMYAGAPLAAFTRYYWRVRVYDGNGEASGWSAPAWFETAMLSPADWKGRWIGDGSAPLTNGADFYREQSMPLFRKAFTTAKRVLAARLYISGLGYYEAYLNGKKIGDHVLDPGWTSYGKRVLYASYDITPLLRPGQNVAGVMLGNGWYNPLPLKMWGRFNLRDALYTGRPCVKALLRLTYADGTSEEIVTDETWQTLPGPVMRNSVYLGEHYDARKEIPGWNEPGVKPAGMKNAVPEEGPPGVLTAQLQPPVRVTRIIKPVAVTTPKPGTYLFDMGQNFAGVARIKVKAPAGARIVLRYGEDKYKDGNINVMTAVAGQIKSGNGGPGAPAVAWQEDSYTAKGGGAEEVWAPRFTFHGFRYVEVTGWPGKPALNDLEGLCLSADVENTGTFTSSDTLFNQLHENIRRTFRSNMFSVQSDCPGREKFGYGGDMFCTSEAFNYNFNMANFYRKVVQDHEDDQRPLGGITETAPYMGIGDSGPGDGSGPLSFQIGFPYVIKELYDFYGDKRVVEAHYPALTRLARFLEDSARNHLYETDLGDHESLEDKSFALTASCFYYLDIRLMAEFAGILGKKEEQSRYAQLADTIGEAVVQRFLDPRTGRFDTGTQSAQVLGLWNNLAAGAAKEAALQTLLRQIGKHKGHLATGIFGTKMLFDVLRRNNLNSVAVEIAGQPDYPGWGYMIRNGATTLWETWAASDNVYSKNHPMFGSVDEWFYRSLLGINPGAPAFEKVIIHPLPAGKLSFARGSYNSVRGPIGSSWRIEGRRLKLNVEIPANTSAEIWVPVRGEGNVTESGNPVAGVKDVKLLRREKGYLVYETGSGRYAFESDFKR